MAHLKITITAKVPLPKGASAAVGETLRVSGIVAHASNRLSDDKIENLVVITQEDDDAEPAPAPKRRSRKPRAALGSSPLRTEEEFAEIDRARKAGIRDPIAMPELSTTGADGEDLLAIPPHLVRS